jgi:septum site-determining protein MinC
VIFEIDPSYEPPRAKPMADGRVRISTGLTRHIAASPDERLTKYINTSLRQDQSIRYNGDVVIVGDVGAGAKVVATGNVIVLGAVRGAVHAGIAGDESATVVSLAFEPSHLRIAGIDYSERRRGPGPRERLWPEIAYLDGGEIAFEPLTERQLSKLTQ